MTAAGGSAGTNSAILAIDIGGTKMAGALVGATGQVTRRCQVPTGEDPTAALASLVSAVTGDGDGPNPALSLAGVGVGCGGPMDWPQGVVRPLNIPKWRAGFAMRDWFSDRFPGRAVRVHNDELCVAAGETWCGAASGHADVLGMVVSTGVGGGLVLNGRLRDGKTGNAGHIGHVIAEPDGPLCGCGARGCLEAVARGPAVVAWARERGSTARNGPELAALAREGDAVAQAAFDRAGAAVGRVVAGAAALLEVDIVVIGGGLASAGELLFAPLRREFAAHAQLHFTRDIPVVPAGLGQDAGLVGAGALLHRPEQFWFGD